MTSFSEYLSREIEKKGITQADLSRMSGLSTAIISQVFSGKTKDPRISTIIKICKHADIDIDEAVKQYDYYIISIED